MFAVAIEYAELQNFTLEKWQAQWTLHVKYTLSDFRMSRSYKKWQLQLRFASV